MNKWESTTTVWQTATEDKLARKSGVVEYAGLFTDKKGMILIVKATGAKETGHAQQSLISMKKLLRIENMFDTIHVFDEYHNERMQPWLTHSMLAGQFVDNNRDEEMCNWCHPLTLWQDAAEARRVCHRGSKTRCSLCVLRQTTMQSTPNSSMWTRSMPTSTYCNRSAPFRSPWLADGLPS